MRTMILALLAVAILGSARCVEAGPIPDAPAGKRVVIATEDGLKIVGTWWDGPKRGPVVVLLHMYRSERSAWRPLVTSLLDRRLSVLAIDLRGHGESAKQGRNDLSENVGKRDAKLFAAMHQDAIAAVRFATKRKGCDAARVGLVGASVGCSVAIDTARRYPGEVRSVLCLTPGAKYLGLDSLAHVSALPKSVSLMLVTHETEAAAGTSDIHAAATKARSADTAAAQIAKRIVDTAPPEDAEGERGYFHGTRMFGRVKLIEPYIAGFMARELTALKDVALLDGDVSAELDRKRSGAWLKATQVKSESGGVAYAYRVGSRVVFGGVMPAGQTYLTLKFRGYARGVNWKEMARGRINIKSLEKFGYASAMFEPPEGHVRLAKTRRPGKQAGGGMPKFEPGKRPRMPSNSGLKTPIRVVFTPHEGGFAFEGEVYLPPVKGTKKMKVDMKWGVTSERPRIPSFSIGGPGMAVAGIDFDPPWTPIPTR